MRRLTGILAIFTLLLTAAPLLACMTDRAISHQESVCCRTMHGNCGGMEKMGCCRKEIQTDEHPQLAASASKLDVQSTVGDCIEPVALQPQSVSRLKIDIAEAHSPPGLIIARTTVLRI